jgi:hypothetical protein
VVAAEEDVAAETSAAGMEAGAALAVSEAAVPAAAEPVETIEDLEDVSEVAAKKGREFGSKW